MTHLIVDDGNDLLSSDVANLSFDMTQQGPQPIVGPQWQQVRRATVPSQVMKRTQTAVTAPETMLSTDCQLSRGDRHGCHLCYATYWDQKSLRRHFATNHNGTEGRCELCDAVFGRCDVLARHHREQHVGGRETVQYNICFKFVRPRAMGGHRASKACKPVSTMVLRDFGSRLSPKKEVDAPIDTLLVVTRFWSTLVRAWAQKRCRGQSCTGYRWTWLELSLKANVIASIRKEMNDLIPLVMASTKYRPPFDQASMMAQALYIATAADILSDVFESRRSAKVHRAGLVALCTVCARLYDVSTSTLLQQLSQVKAITQEDFRADHNHVHCVLNSGPEIFVDLGRSSNTQSPCARTSHCWIQWRHDDFQGDKSSSSSVLFTTEAPSRAEASLLRSLYPGSVDSVQSNGMPLGDSTRAVCLSSLSTDCRPEKTGKNMQRSL